MERTDYFSIYELYFLLDAFQGKVLMGLPPKEELNISSESIWDDAKEALIEKNIVDEAGSLTESGFVITEVLREYCLGQSLTILNNFYIMQSSEEHFSIVIVDTLEGYQILKLSPLSLLFFLQEKVPVFLREGRSNEKEFLQQELSLTEELKTVLSGGETLVIQNYPLKNMLESKYQQEFVSQLLVVEHEEELLVYDVKENKLNRFSQYYFLERMYKWLSIPFREEDFN